LSRSATAGDSTSLPEGRGRNSFQPKRMYRWHRREPELTIELDEAAIPLIDNGRVHRVRRPWGRLDDRGVVAHPRGTDPYGLLRFRHKEHRQSPEVTLQVCRIGQSVLFR
jgi:hypothetical protein